jgi:hypothetical protein
MSKSAWFWRVLMKQEACHFAEGTLKIKLLKSE